MLKTHLLRRGATFFLTVVILVAVVVVPSALTQGSNPFAGTWKANLSKSQRHPNHLFQSLTLHFEVSDDTVLLTFTGVNMAGKQESGTSKLHPDGKEYPVAEAPSVVEVSKWVGSHILETVAKKDGKVIGQSTYEVSGDGNTLTAKIKGIDESGTPFEQAIVFDRG
jgi:hypothetical protein